MDSHDRNGYQDDARGGRRDETVQHGMHSRVERTGSDAAAGGHAAHATRLQGRSRSPLAWLLPLLLLALVAGAAYWMMDRSRIDRDGDPEAAIVGTSGRTDAAALGALDPGADVNVSRARITEVVGDRTFWVGEGSSRALVVIPEDSSGAASREQRQRFTRGQEVSITGTVAQRTTTPEGLDQADRQAIAGANGRVIVATRVRQISE